MIDIFARLDFLIQISLQQSLEWSTRPYTTAPPQPAATTASRPHLLPLSSSRARPASVSGISYLLFPLPEALFHCTYMQLTLLLCQSLCSSVLFSVRPPVNTLFKRVTHHPTLALRIPLPCLILFQSTFHSLTNSIFY